MAARPRHALFRLNGVLLLDKPIGLTSNAAVQRVRFLLGARKAGHTGSLDPLATGVLPICLGEATKLAGLLLDTDKRYRATIQLGVTTDTGDSTGRVIANAPVPSFDAPSLQRLLEQFRGRIEQVPPMYSALKQSGVRLYELARRGIEVERQGRAVEIHELSLVGHSDDRLHLQVHCSTGTYIRVLAEDIGRALGCGAHITALQRTAVGPLTLCETVSLDVLEELAPSERLARIGPMDRLVSGLPRVDCDDEAARGLRHGQVVAAPATSNHGMVRLYDASGVFFGIGSTVDGILAPRRMFNLDDATSEVSRGTDAAIRTVGDPPAATLELVRR